MEQLSEKLVSEKPAQQDDLFKEMIDNISKKPNEAPQQKSGQQLKGGPMRGTSTSFG